MPAPEAGPLSTARVYRLVADLKVSETRMSLCGHRVVSMWKGMQ